MQIENYAVRDFCLGKTRRWAIAWSFGSKRLTESAHLRGYQPKTEFETGPLFETPENLEEHLDAVLKDLEMPGREGEATVNTWSRAARRGGKRQKTQFGYRFDIQDDVLSATLTSGERSAFESFWNHVKKRVEELCGIKRGSTFY